MSKVRARAMARVRAKAVAGDMARVNARSAVSLARAFTLGTASSA